MGYNNYNPFKAAVGNVGDYFKGLFKQPASAPGMNTVPTTVNQSLSPNVPGYNYNPYQVQIGDTFETIAKKNNMTAAQIQNANNGMLVPPPKGSYINIPNASVYATPGTPNGMTTNAPTNYDPAMRGRGYNSSYAPPYTGWDSNRSDVVDPNVLSDIQTQITNGQAPMRVPVGALAQLGATPQSMVENGYVFDPVSRTYVLSTPQSGQQLTGTGGWVGPSGAVHNSNNNWETNDRLHLITMNRNARNRNNRYVTTLAHAKTQWQHAKQRAKGARPGQQPQAVEQVAANSGTTPMTVLNLHLGGG